MTSTNDQAALSGDITGTLTSSGSGTAIDGHFTAAAVAVLTLTDSPCGVGSIVIVNIFTGSPTSDFTGTWRVSAGQGTGDLVDVKGQGTIEVQPAAPAVFSGRIACR